MRLLITGDYCPCFRLEEAIQSKNPFDILGRSLIGKIEEVDLAITNLECPVTKNTDPINKTGPALKSGKYAISFLKNAGFELVTLANNHIMDYGVEGLNDTLKYLEEQSIQFVGAGLTTSQRNNSYRTEKDGLTISILNFAENEWSTNNCKGAGALGINLTANFRSIQHEKQVNDIVIVIVHGGHEMYSLPSPEMKDRYRFFADAGADVIIGHHTHCISGYEIYDGTPIFYSLGNFLFDHEEYRNTIWNKGMAVELIINKEIIEFQIIHFNQCNEEPVLELVSDKEISEREKKLHGYGQIIEKNDRLSREFASWVKHREKNYRTYIEPHKYRIIQALQNRGLLPSFWSERKKSYLLNLIRCESHREILQNILENDHSYTQQ